MKILITGASSGIGKAFARQLAKKENELILVGRNEERLNETKNEVLKAGVGGAVTLALDLSKKENCLLLHDRYPDVDLLINNAGFGDFGEFTETSLDRELLMIDTNIAAMHTIFKSYLKTMVEKDEGQILNVASIAGFMPGPLMATYYATKSYVVRLNEGVRKELKKKKSHVKLSILCPGPVKTGFEKNANISFNFHGVAVDGVAKYALRKLGKFYIVPCLPVRVSRFFLKVLPSPLIASAIYFAQNRRRKPTGKE